ncbi:MAG: hypothetical protein E7192_08045 [Erysipelotrichaceae bacterium]|nr:hypothetical protein [Erysipelotrichaceae bacterium]MBQ4342665.1 hypothetical protein [Erysipelotrichaceae bacterium]
MKIDHLSKSEKEIIVHYLMRCYRASKGNVSYLEECDLIMEKKEEYRNEKKTCLLIERALDEMDVELRDIVEDEFLNRKKVQLLEKHSRSNYYRLRNQAVDDFLRCL